jgi:hypothetical protein
VSVATEDVELGGQIVRAGEAVVVVMSSANRDEAVLASVVPGAELTGSGAQLTATAVA